MAVLIDVLVPHLGVPLTNRDSPTTSGRPWFGINEQDSLEDIEACVLNILRYPQGYRAEEPEFGIIPQEFRMGGTDIIHIREQVTRWEPRVEALADEQLADLVARVQLEIKARTDA